MKDLLYLDYPEICQISANITNRRYKNNNTQIILDRTIIYPKNDYLLDEKAYVSSLKVIDVSEKNGKILHLLEGKPNSSKLLLKIDKNIRLHNLYYNTSFLIMQFVLKIFYNIDNCKLQIKKDYGQLLISDFFVDFDKEKFEDYINYIISLDLSIKKTINETEILSLGKLDKSYLSFNKTGDIFGFHILRYEKLADNLLIDFISGRDFLDFNKNNYKLLEEIEKLATSQSDDKEKIRKIISSLQNSKNK